MRKHVGDDDLLFAALRILMPPYDGPPMLLYRGQREGHPIGVSWSRGNHIAAKLPPAPNILDEEER